MIDFSTVKKLTIPEGTVKRITDANGNVLWVSTRIRFGIDDHGRITYYTAEEGMTWSQWTSSQFNTDGYYVSGNSIWQNSILRLASVTSNGIIDADEVYLIVMAL